MKFSLQKKLNQVGMLSLHVIVPLVLAVTAIGGIGAYVISTSSAAGWTRLYSTYNSNKSVYYSVYACKYPVPKQGYKIKSYAYIGQVSGTQPKTTKSYKMNLFHAENYIGYGVQGANVLPSTLKVGQYLYSPTSDGYAKLDSKFSADLLEIYKDGNPLNSSSKGDHIVSTLSTCP